MKKSFMVIVCAFVLLIGIGMYLYFSALGADHTALAQCLSEKQAVMYGTEWCQHCRSQKQLFGKAFQYIIFVDCDRSAQVCDMEGVKSYPTWKVLGQTLQGTQTLEALASAAGCPMQ